MSGTGVVTNLVGVPANQVLNWYTQQRSIHISALSDDMLRSILFAAGGITATTPPGNGHTDGMLWRPTGDLEPRSMQGVLACRQVNSRWRALSAQPVVATALLHSSVSSGYLLKIQRYIHFLLGKHTMGVLAGGLITHPAAAHDFFVLLYENGLNGGLRAAPDDIAPMKASAAYYDFLFRQGLTRPGLVVCLPSQLQTWFHVLQSASSNNGSGMHWVPVVYSGTDEERASLIKAASERAHKQSSMTIFVAAFSTIEQECCEAAESDDKSDDESDYESGKHEYVLMASSSFIVDGRVAPSGTLHFLNLHERLHFLRLHERLGPIRQWGRWQIPVCVQLQPVLLQTAFRDAFELFNTIHPGLAVQSDNLDGKKAILVALLDTADRFSFGDQSIAQWGLDGFAAPLLMMLAGVFLKR